LGERPLERRLTGYTMTNDNIEAAVDAWCTDEAAATTTYGHISTWGTSGVTSMVVGRAK